MPGIHAKSTGGGDFEIPPAGAYIGRCYRMVDIGTQPQTFQGKPATAKPKVWIWWEILTDDEGNEIRMTDGKPFTVMQSYTLSMHKQATLRKMIDGWRPKPITEEEAKDFDITKLLNKYCRLRLTHDEKGERTYVNIASLEGTKKTPEAVNEKTYWSISEPDMAVFNDMPSWLQNKIKDAPEWLEDGSEGDIDNKGNIVKAKPAPDDVETEDDDEESHLDLDDMGW